MDNQYDQLFSELEDLQESVVPPKLEKLYKKAHEYEAMLAEATAEGQVGIQLDSLIEQCVAELDAECPFNDQQVKVTGRIRRSYYDEIDQQYVDTDVAVDQAPMISRGFYVVTLDDDGEYSYTLGHYFELPDGVVRHRDVSIPFADVMMRHYAFAPVGSIDIEYERTTEENLVSLESSIPDVLAEFDSIVLNAKDECEATRSLRYMKFDAQADVPREVIENFLTYAHDCLEFDMEVPYVFEVQGLIKTGENDESSSDDEFIDYMYIRDEPMKIVGYVTGLMIDSVIDMKDGASVETNEHHWHAIVQVLSKAPDDEQVSIPVPVRAIRSMSSLRRSAYGIE
jgi:hypothetical protein